MYVEQSEILFRKVKKYFKENDSIFHKNYSNIFSQKDLRALLSYVNEIDHSISKFPSKEEKFKKFIIGIYTGKK